VNSTPPAREFSAVSQPAFGGLYRTRFSGSGSPLQKVFSAIETSPTTYSLSMDPASKLIGTSFGVDSTQGSGTWHLLSIGKELYVAATDALYDEPRVETISGEGNFEFYVKLSGDLRLEMPGGGELQIAGPTCMILRLAPGISIRERLQPGAREICISINCRPKFISELIQAAMPGKANEAWRKLNNLNELVSYQFLRLTPSMAGCVRALHGWQHAGILGLLYGEAKVLELVCLVVDALCADKGAIQHGAPGAEPDRRIDKARAILHSSTSSVPKAASIARKVGVCESKLKRDFKRHFGKTMFEYSLERRMLIALDALRSNAMPISAIAVATGFRHHSSFTAAFRRFFGFLPKYAGKASRGTP